LRNPELLIFDEATSSLDSIIEKEITDTIKATSHQQDHLLTILVAHRLSTIMHADQIFVLEQ
jgi:ATP-binding cassette subfamily B protein